MDEIRCKLSLTELQTFVSDAVRIVDDRPLTTVSSVPNHLSLLTPAFFLGQQLAPNTPVGRGVFSGIFRGEPNHNRPRTSKNDLSYRISIFASNYCVRMNMELIIYCRSRQAILKFASRYPP